MIYMLGYPALAWLLYAMWSSCAARPFGMAGAISECHPVSPKSEIRKTYDIFRYPLPAITQNYSISPNISENEKHLAIFDRRFLFGDFSHTLAFHTDGRLILV